MYHHEPVNYICPFCCLIKKIEYAQSQLIHSDIVQQNELATAFMATRRYPNNQGHVLVVPNQHFENIFDLPAEFATHIHQLTQSIAFAMKIAYHCDGILIHHQNEPDGGQHIWHYHQHIIPRFEKDNFHNCGKHSFPTNEREKFARKLRAAFVGG